MFGRESIYIYIYIYLVISSKEKKPTQDVTRTSMSSVAGARKWSRWKLLGRIGHHFSSSEWVGCLSGRTNMVDMTDLRQPVTFGQLAKCRRTSTFEDGGCGSWVVAVITTFRFDAAETTEPLLFQGRPSYLGAPPPRLLCTLCVNVAQVSFSSFLIFYPVHLIIGSPEHDFWRQPKHVYVRLPHCLMAPSGPRTLARPSQVKQRR